MTAPTDSRRPEFELSDSEFLRWAARSITESTEQLREALARLEGQQERGADRAHGLQDSVAQLEATLGLEPPRPQLRLVRSPEAGR